MNIYTMNADQSIAWIAEINKANNTNVSFECFTGLPLPGKKEIFVLAINSFGESKCFIQKKGEII